MPRSEHPATRLQRKPRFERPGIGGVESEDVDQLEHHSNYAAVIAGRCDGDAARTAPLAPALIELQVAEEVEAFHDSRG